MVIATIDDENFDIDAPERPSHSDPAEAASQDDDTRCLHASAARTSRPLRLFSEEQLLQGLRD
jgi:hypothetical protein